jgi:hypothetical protein
MRLIIDLFSGLDGWTEAFKNKEGWFIISVENNANLPFKTANNQHRILGDILDPATLEKIKLVIECLNFKGVEIVTASPPCQGFSVASCFHHWTKDGQPKSDKAQLSLELVDRTLTLIHLLNPRYYIIENPRGLLRKQEIMINTFQTKERRTIWYCKYGANHAKPTDLWGNMFEGVLELRPECHNMRRNKKGDLIKHCHHEPAPRGSSSGVQGLKNNAVRSIIPFELSNDLFKAVVE